MTRLIFSCKGEIHALWRNGAGKSTLMNMLAGLLNQCWSIIVANGNTVNLDSPFKSSFRIGMENLLCWLKPHSLLKILSLGLKPLNMVFWFKKASQDILLICLNMVWQWIQMLKLRDISVGAQQRVEILQKTLYRSWHPNLWDQLRCWRFAEIEELDDNHEELGEWRKSTSWLCNVGWNLRFVIA